MEGEHMVHVVAALRIKEGRLDDFMKLFKELAPIVRQEKGCVQYIATVDAENTGVPIQTIQKNEVTFVEKWESVGALEAHMQTPHMKAQGEKEKGIVEGIVLLKILEEI
jgi:quinol monooxygenase YgiN